MSHGHRKPKRSEGQSKVQHIRTFENKVKRLKVRLKNHPDDLVAKKRLEFYQNN